jgi:pantoate--beta-alanine ligase
VPDDGRLHAGHLALVDAARRRAATVVMSVFVNPLQFGPAEDFARYPRDAEGDAAKARERGVDVLFTPGPRRGVPARAAGPRGAGRDGRPVGGRR